MTLHLHAVPSEVRFRVGDTWEPREPDVCMGEPDHWTIIAITDHPRRPVVAQHACGATRAFTPCGHFGLASDATDLDLTTLVAAQKRSVA